ncbi:hypothetical protein GGE65_007317 [Skermanella aerolata]|uniref:hypothetical protein n=1 Tax=Skermanella aerolata TaxID=393310 RepID=UPI003D1D4E0D
MTENSKVVRLRQPDEIEDPLTAIGTPFDPTAPGARTSRQNFLTFQWLEGRT